MSFKIYYAGFNQDTQELLSFSAARDSLAVYFFNQEIYAVRLSDEAADEIRELLAQGHSQKAKKFMKTVAHSMELVDT